MKVGDTGYFYVLDATPGKRHGDLLVHPAKEGQNILDSRDAGGRDFIREMLEKKSGLTTLPVAERRAGRDRAAHEDRRLRAVQGLELADRRRHLRRRDHRRSGAPAQPLPSLIGLVALAVFAADPARDHEAHRHPPARPGARRRRAHRPGRPDGAHRRRPAATRSACWPQAMNSISSGLSGVVGQVRAGAEQIAKASGEISAGNLDLCARTEAAGRQPGHHRRHRCRP